MHRQIPKPQNVPSAVGATKHVWIVTVKRRAVQGNSLNVQSASDVKEDANTQNRVIVTTKHMRGLLNLVQSDLGKSMNQRNQIDWILLSSEMNWSRASMIISNTCTQSRHMLFCMNYQSRNNISRARLIGIWDCQSLLWLKKPYHRVQAL